MGPVLPSAFKWGSRLRRLQLAGIAISSLSLLLSPSLDLVDLQLHEVPSVGYFSPEELASALSGMTQLQSLSLHFLSPALRPSHIYLSPSPGERVLRRFIDQIEMQKSHRRADIVFSGRAVSITFTQPEAHARLTLQISCEQSNWQLPSIAQVRDHFILSSVQDLGIDTTQRPSEKDDVDGEQWLELIRAFDGAGDFRVPVELATDNLRALCPVDGKHTTVLPALRNLLILGLVPLRRVVESFTALRRFSGHPVQVYPLSIQAQFLC
ncbi:hypothetical protein BJY52DRAFT_1217141 [Lactarius psammicola]|nr:hypothetical protein BJY52DRAFT_1217141 [Lactarius psammicola]